MSFTGLSSIPLPKDTMPIELLGDELVSGVVLTTVVLHGANWLALAQAKADEQH